MGVAATCTFTRGGGQYHHAVAGGSAINTVSPVAGVSKARLVNYGMDPVWSPDGMKVVFVRGTELFVMDASGANPKLLSDAQGGADFQPAWGTAAAQTAKN